MGSQVLENPIRLWYISFMKKIFISYAHKDEEWKDRLVTQLKVLQLEGFCDVWEDRQIRVGDDWKPGIETALKEADIAILMVSAAFLVSNFIRTEEVPRILERRETEGLWVIPVFVKPCPWQKVGWLQKIEGEPRDGTTLEERDGGGQAERILADLAGKIAERIQADDQTGAAVKLTEDVEKPLLLVPKFESAKHDPEDEPLSTAMIGERLIRHWTNKLFGQCDLDTGGFRGFDETDPETQAWSTAQCVTALALYPSSAHAELLRTACRYLESQREKDGWALWPGGQTVTEIGAWATMALHNAWRVGQVFQPHERNEVQARIERNMCEILTRQYSNGGFSPIHPVTENNTRTYSTVVALWSIGAALSSGAVADEADCRLALTKGIRWLLNNYTDAPTRWTPNPNRRKDKKNYLGLSAQALLILMRLERFHDGMVHDLDYLEVKEQLINDPTLSSREFDDNDQLSDSDQHLEGSHQNIEGSTYLWFIWTLAALSGLARDRSIPAELARKALKQRDRMLVKLQGEDVWRRIGNRGVYEIAETLVCLAYSLDPTLRVGAAGVEE
ncbi:MAG: TIR domain-containing protein [bacterium]|nr:TIR domain-containing protein [bacterium]